MRFFLLAAASAAIVPAVPAGFMMDAGAKLVAATVTAQVQRDWTERDRQTLEDRRALLTEYLRAEVRDSAGTLELPAASSRLDPCVPSGGPDCAQTTVTYAPVGVWHPGLSTHGPAQDLYVRIDVTTTDAINGLTLAAVHSNVVVHWSPSELVVEPASDEAVVAAAQTSP